MAYTENHLKLQGHRCVRGARRHPSVHSPAKEARQRSSPGLNPTAATCLLLSSHAQAKKVGDHERPLRGPLCPDWL